MWENWDKLLNEIVIIKWGVVCLVFMCWCKVLYLLGKEISKWWGNHDKKKKKKPFTLKQMNKDLAAASRPRRDNWDG